MALSLHVEAGVIDGEVPAGAQRIDQFHPAGVAFRRAGGEGDLWVALADPGRPRTRVQRRRAHRRHRCRPRPAARQRPRRVGRALRTTMLALASELEGHADNVAASLFGGIVATADGRAVRVPLAFDPAVVVWIPSFTTSTDESRTKLGTRRAAGRRRVQHRQDRAAGRRAGRRRHRRAAQRHAGSPAPGSSPGVRRTVEGGAAVRRSMPARGARGCRAPDRPWPRCARSTTPTNWQRSMPATATPRCCASITAVP